MNTALMRRLDQQLAALPAGLRLLWPGGSAGAGRPAVVLRLRRRHLLAQVAAGRIGDLADAYVRGELDIEGPLDAVMAAAAALVGDPVQRGERSAAWAWLARLRSWWLHGRRRDARQVRFHYDTSDAFYSLWLDPLRVYSCAYFAQPGATLEQAQQAKLELVCRKLRLAPGARLLDIGAGWGALLIWAAQHHGVRATGITLSRRQHAYVDGLIAATGLRGQVEMRLQDYRDLPAGETFDSIASIGMFEHVGRARIGGYFDTLHARLRPGGLLLNHAIAAGGLANDELGAGMGPFIERHVFPGGELVHVTETARAIAGSGLELLDAENLRPHYAHTLWAWSDALEQHLDRARALTSEATVRAYRLYLAGSALCFERGWLSLYQLLATRPNEAARPLRTWAARSDHPFTRHHMAI
jgi:cyclopropane-fatty-acyl-phospholipid synthase